VSGEDGRQIPEHYAAELVRFYQAHAQWLAGHAYLRTSRDRDLAEDLVQDTFEAAARDWKTLRVLVPEQQRAWLRNTLWHKDTDQFRRRKVRLGRPVQTSAELEDRIVGLHRRRRLTARAIARVLETEGVPAPRGGVRWHHGTVADIIRRRSGRLKPGRPRKVRRSRSRAG
jgi:DNA-directed RNA polymerase specialized sigma24 family protein